MMKEIDLPHHWKHWQALTVKRMYLPLVPSWNRSLSVICTDHPSGELRTYVILTLNVGLVPSTP